MRCRAWGCGLVLLLALLAGCRPAGRFNVRPTNRPAPSEKAPAGSPPP